MIFKNNKLYDVLKWIALVALDALGLAYETIATIWNLPYGDEIHKTCTAISVLIGTFIGISSIKYNNTTPDIIEIEDDELLEGRDE